jgi:hypothetical protein
MNDQVEKILRRLKALNSKPSDMLDRIADKALEESRNAVRQAAESMNHADIENELLCSATACALMYMERIMRQSAEDERAKEAALAKREESAP